ncbi:hypothetical protein LCGC14_0448720 [marine sediment metagenome]|uniref:Uncharacterized protein n=1 Tax=marine sediment metagenome TaxID=412755 RepID=A0A0F9V561_9ZZZZ
MNEIERGNQRFVINMMRASYNPDQAALDMLADIETWFRKALPHYKNSWSLKAKAQGIRGYTKAVYALVEEFFADCEDQGITIPRSGLIAKSDIERAIEGR